MALRRGHLECGANCWPDAVTSSRHVYEVRPRKDHRGVDLISDVLPFGGPGMRNKGLDVSEALIQKSCTPMKRHYENDTHFTIRLL
jgi:hypothetical protein